MLTHGNLTAEVSMLSRVFVLNEDEVVLSLLPLHHTFEFTCGMLLPLSSGSKISFIPSGSMPPTCPAYAGADSSDRADRRTRAVAGDPPPHP